MGLLEELMDGFRPAAVFALVGQSGTGKSFRSKLLAEKYGIRAIIDDGLLIQDDKILAGRSAKREKTYMGAVRVALFDDKEHRDDVAKALKKTHIKKILLLGTSEKMVFKIATRLQLPPPQKIIKIEDIATREEIEKAIKTRTVEGKLFEKSIVQPEFSKKGRIEISEAALTQMVMHCVSECDIAVRVKKLSIKTDTHGYRVIITIDVPFGTQLTGKIHHLQQYIIDKIESYTGILIEEVSIIIDKITGADFIDEKRRR